jgi:hypothetical protein
MRSLMIPFMDGIFLLQQCCICGNIRFMESIERGFFDKWTILPRGDVAPHWSGLYASLNRAGSLVITRVTHERLGSPEAFLIMFDPVNARLALRPAELKDANAYPARKWGRRGSKVIRAYRLVTEFAIRPSDTIEFISPVIDDEGRLVLNLKNVRISPKAHSQRRDQGRKQINDDQREERDGRPEGK